MIGVDSFFSSLFSSIFQLFTGQLLELISGWLGGILG